MAEYLPLHNIYNNVIYMCDAFKASHYEYLARKKINAMLFIHNTNKDINVLRCYTEVKVQHYFAEAPENQDKCNFEKLFKKCIKIIGHFDKYDGRIVVYCQTGCHYAPLVIAAYLLYKFYVVEKKKPHDNKSIVVHLLEIIAKQNRDVSLGDINIGIMALARFERAKIKERNMLDQISNANVENVNRMFDEEDSE